MSAAGPADSIQCPRCGSSVPAGTEFCPRCGARVKPAASFWEIAQRWVAGTIVGILALLFGAAGACFLILTGFGGVAFVAIGLGCLVIAGLLFRSVLRISGGEASTKPPDTA